MIKVKTVNRQLFFSLICKYNKTSKAPSVRTKFLAHGENTVICKNFLDMAVRRLKVE